LISKVIGTFEGSHGGSRFASITLLSVAMLVVSCSSSGNNGGISNNGGIPAFSLYWSVAVGDLNGDGKLDIATGFTHFESATKQPGFVSVYLEDSSNPGSFRKPSTYSAGPAPSDFDPSNIVIADLNGDGKLDLVSSNSQRTSNTGGVSIYFQDPANPGQFLSATNYATGNHPAGIAVGDLNGDGKPDIAIAGVNGVSILFQDPNNPGTFLAPTTVSVGSGTSSVAIADVNGDGKADLVVTTATAVAVLLQVMPGSFSPAATYNAGQQPIYVVVADLNGDGKPDLAVANLGSPTDGTTSSLEVLLQDPNVPGTFLAATHYKTDIRSESLAIADLNGDGKLDIAVANTGALAGPCPPSCGSSGASVSVLLQDPTFPGRFQPATNYAGNDQVLSVAIGDMNGDGKPDLVLTEGGTVVIRFQDPAHPGQFLSRTVIQQ
jgi:hypothetical protein